MTAIRLAAVQTALLEKPQTQGTLVQKSENRGQDWRPGPEPDTELGRPNFQRTA